MMNPGMILSMLAAMGSGCTPQPELAPVLPDPLDAMLLAQGKTGRKARRAAASIRRRGGR